MTKNTYFTHSEMLLIHEALVQNLERYRHLIESAPTQGSDAIAILKEKLEFKLNDLQTLNQRVQSYLLAQLP